MRKFFGFLLLISISGCAPFRNSSSARHDPFDDVEIEQMAGNDVSGRIFERTLLCLNARRETRPAQAITNYIIQLRTNIVIVPLTNQTVTLVTNRSRTSATNQIPPPLIASAPAEAEPKTTPGGTHAEDSSRWAANTLTNQTATSTSNSTLSKSGAQTVATSSLQSQVTIQVTANTPTASVTTAETEWVTAETNLAVSFSTNVVITSATNEVVIAPSKPRHDYFLYTELTPPPDFTLANGESLVLLVDGIRHGLTATNSQAALVARKGFLTALYRVDPQLLVDIANAREVKVRVRGQQSIVEKAMSVRSRNRLKTYLLKYFAPAPESDVIGNSEQAGASLRLPNS
ncbi:MAG: hypothetical protein AB1813_14090 [Verrucomicrobiota bacterium]